MSKKMWRAFCAVTSHPAVVKAMQGACILLLAGSLAACNTTGTTSGQLPTVPADIQTCFHSGPVAVPQRALTVADVESLWKKDRIRVAVQRACGERFLAWYGDLQKGWK